MPRADYYTVLGVARTATDADLRRAYRELALRHHPDKNPDSVAEATEKFKLVAEAYSVLKDPQTRAAYDEDSSLAGTSFTFEKASDLFSDVFGSELASTLGRAARGLVSAPGAVLGAAAHVCQELPGVRGAVAAGYESMVADAELRLDFQVRRMGTLDEKLDAAWHDIKENDEEIELSRQRRKAEVDRERQELWLAFRFVVPGFIACVGIHHMEAIRPLLILVLPGCGYLIYLTVGCLLDMRHLLQRHALMIAAEEQRRSELQRSLSQAQEAFEVQRKFAAEARQELHRVRGTATEATQNGPSLSHAFAVSSHVVGNVVGSVFGRLGSKSTEDCDAAHQSRLT
jgi:curved DNA-binding protein CbpA